MMTTKMNPLYIPRKENNISIDNSNDFDFLPIDWYECDIKEDSPEKAFFLNKSHNMKYNIFSFGVNSKGESICLKITNYHPYLYFQIPENFTEQNIKDFKSVFSTADVEEIEPDDYKYSDNDEKQNIKFESRYYKSSISEYGVCIEESQIFWSFMNGKLFKFLKVPVKSKLAHKFFMRYFKEERKLPIFGLKEPIKYLQFENDLEILLRYFHDRKILPSNWIKIPKHKYSVVGKTQSKCQINIVCKWDDVFPIDKTEVPPLIVASFDIEADSSHGDFPIPRKDCKKLSNQLVVAWLRDMRTVIKESKESPKYKKAFANLQTRGKFFENRIRQALSHRFNLINDDNYEIDEDIDYLYLKDEFRSNILDKTSFQESLELFYKICNREISKVKANTEMKKAVTKVMNKQDETIEKNGYISFDEFLGIIERVARKDKLDPSLLKSKIITKEIMVRFVNQELNKMFGNAEGDKVIQIGTVFWRYGEDEPFHNNIITLKGCSPFKVGDKNCEVISYETEKQILLEWAKLIEKYDPDIITGYNIFGFDETFMYDRLIEMVGNFNKKNITNDDIRTLESNVNYNRFMNLTRLSNDMINKIPDARGKLNLKKLASSALGENYLYYFNMPGRVQIDLLKVCQASLTKLPSYKLDSVAEFYISGKIKNFVLEEDEINQTESCKLIVENIKELDEGNFIIISMLTTGQKLYDGDKLKILEVDKDKNMIVVDKPVPVDCKSTIPMWGLGKDDVSPKDIFRLQKGNDDDRSIVAKYCIQDCALLIRLLQKLDTIINNFGMSNVCLIPFSYIFMRGQGIKIFSLVVNECSQNNYKLPVLEKVEPEEQEYDIKDRVKVDALAQAQYLNDDDDDDHEGGKKKKKKGEDEDNSVFQLKSDFNVIKMTEDSYEGAIVLTPKPDIYTEPITVLDFSSLYPSEMIASDLSHDRLCEDPYWLGEEGAKRIRALGLDFHDRTYDNYSWVDPKNKNKGKVKNGTVTDRFIIHPTEKGLISRILMKLLAARKATKKRMNSEKDPMKVPILEGLQLAYKVTANSIYGQTGAKTSQIYKKQIAASTTAGGRMRIYTARDYCLENNPGCDVVYGDSVPGDEPIFISCGKQDYMYANQDRDWKSENNYDKTYKFCRIDELIKYSKPATVFNEIPILDNSDEKEYFVPNFKINVWSSSKMTNIKWIIRHKTHKKLYRVYTTTGVVEVTEDHSLLDENQNIIRPGELKVGMKLLTNNIPIKFINKTNLYRDNDLFNDIELKSILTKYLRNYGFNKINEEENHYNQKEVNNLFYKDVIMKISNKYFRELKNGQLDFKEYDKVTLTKLFYFNKYFIKGNTEFHYTDDLISFYNTNHSINDGLITKIECLGEYTDYVYDIETLNHTFGAGIGNIIVHNTDSVFVKFNLVREDGTYPETDIEKIQRSIDIGMYLQQKLKDDKTFPPPHDLEYEKVFYPLILITKKRYIGMKYEFDAKVGKKTSMGVVTKRRDNAPILKHTFIGVTDTLMQEKNIVKAIEFTKKICYQMVDNYFELNMFVISKTLREYYKDPESIAHKVLADRMAERDPGNKPSPNERIPYVYIKIDEQPGVEYLQGDRIEHINYVRENKCQVDYETYITNQIMKPVSQIFELVVEKIPGYQYDSSYLMNLENKYYNKYDGDLKKTIKKVSDEKQKIIKKLVFNDILTYTHNKIHKINTMDKYLSNFSDIKNDNSMNMENMMGSSLNSKINKRRKNKNTANDNNISSSNEEILKKVNKNAKKDIRIKKLKQLDISNFFG